MRFFSWTGNNKPLSEEEFNELASTDKGLRSMRYPFKYQRSDDKTKTGMYVTVRNYNDVREFSQEQHERATAMFEAKREEKIKKASEKGVLTFIGMGMEFEPKIDDGIGNYRIRCMFVDSKGDKQFIEVHPSVDGGFYGEHVFCSVNERNEAEYLRRMKEYEEKYGKYFWLKISRDEKEEMDHLIFHQYEQIKSSTPFTYAGLLGYVNKQFGVEFKELFYENFYLNHDDIQFNPSRF